MTTLSTPVISDDLRGRGYHYNSPNDRHEGIDYGWYYADPEGSRRVFAAAAGTVVSVAASGSYNGGWGNRIVVEHAPGVRTSYSHLLYCQNVTLFWRLCH